MMAGPQTLLISPWQYREYLRQASPSRFLLYSSGWRAGFTVNGMTAHD